MNDFMITAITSFTPGSRYVMRHSGFSLTHTPIWVLVISGGAALAIAVLMIRDQFQKRRDKAQSVC